MYCPTCGVKVEGSAARCPSGHRVPRDLVVESVNSSSPVRKLVSRARKLVGWTLVPTVVMYLLVVVVSLVLPLLHQPIPRDEISYSDFLDKARSGQITQVTVGDKSVSGQLRDGRQFRTFIPAGDSSYIDVLQHKGATITVEPRSRSALWQNIATTALPFLILVGILLSMFRFQPRWRS